MSTSNTAEIGWWTCLLYFNVCWNKRNKNRLMFTQVSGTYAHGGVRLRTLQNDTKTAVVTNSSKGLTVMVGLKLGTWFLKSWKRKSGKFYQRNKICQSNESCIALDHPVFALPHYTIIGWCIPFFFGLSLDYQHVRSIIMPYYAII